MELRALHQEAEQNNAMLRRLIEAVRNRLRRTRELLAVLQGRDADSSR